MTYFVISYLIYLVLAWRIVRSAIRYRSYGDVRLAFYVAAIAWVYFVVVMTIAFVTTLTGIDLPINLDNVRDYLRVMGLPLLASTSYLILRIFP